jgi:hypothetical protein
MMKYALVLVSAVSVALSAPAAAQQTSSQCPPGTSTGGIPDRQRATQDACQQAVDLFQYMVPQLGIAITGGNATLGQASTLGGLGRISVGLRANVLQGDVPQVDQVSPATSTNGAVRRTNYPTKSQLLGLPTVDAAIGIFKGIPLSMTNVAGLDLLVSASYIPEYEGDGLSVKPDNPLKLGYGVRVGAMQESIFLPALSFTYLRRDLPRTTINGVSNGSSMTVKDLDVQTTAWRAVASKSFVMFGLAAGIGQDTYKASTVAQGTVGSPISVTSDPIALSQDLTRTNYFADLSLNLMVAKLVGEVGMVSGGTVTTYNQFDTDPARSRVYGSVGLRLAF